MPFVQDAQLIEKLNFAAKGGQSIGGRLRRGASGKFEGGEGEATGEKPDIGPEGYPEGEGPADWGLEKSDQELMAKLASNENVSEEELQRLRDMGIATEGGNFTRAGSRLNKALKKGDLKTVFEMMQKGGFQGIKAKKAAKVPEPKEKKKKDKKDKAAPAPEPAPAPSPKGVDEKTIANRQAVVDAIGDAYDAGSIDTFLTLSDGGSVTDKDTVDKLVSDGLLTNEDGKYKMSDQGKTLLAALNAGDAKAAAGALNLEVTEEADTKKMGNRTHERGDFLVVEDPDKPTTWRLPVKVQGTPNRGLAGAAWAALYSPGGYRGNKYEGPQKGEAQSKLKALYKREKWPMPKIQENADMTIKLENYLEIDGNSDITEYDVDVLREYMQAQLDGDTDRVTLPAKFAEYGDDNIAYVPGATSFADLFKAKDAMETSRKVSKVSHMLPMLIENIMRDPNIEDKAGAVEALSKEFMQVMQQTMSGQTTVNENRNGRNRPELADGDAELGEILTEVAVEFAEAENDDSPAKMKVKAIQPGWGNTRDNHYYPAAMLKRDAKKFIGAKMYESEHGKKTTRDWVSSIDRLIGFDEGAPIFEVAVHDPEFAKRVRNLSELGLLHKMECSILAAGRVRQGFEQNGRKGSLVEGITEVYDVDWVTKAGAGGHAVGLIESDAKPEGGSQMSEQTSEKRQADESIEEKMLQEQESDSADKPTADATKPEPAAKDTEQAKKAAELSTEKVEGLVAESSLPDVAKERLSKGTYADEDAVKAAITAEVEYLKRVTNSGKPAKLGETQYSPDPEQKIKEVDTAKSAALQEAWG